MSDFVDLRSDTVTRPTPEMRRAMAEAVVGDDVFSDDPTVNRLQDVAAELMGKEAALLVPTGSMGNQVAIRTHTVPGDAIIADRDAHVIQYEVGAPAVLSSVITDLVPSRLGVLDYDAVAARIRQQTTHTPGTTLLCLENTHNRAGGTITPLDHVRRLSDLAHTNGLKVHLDGARIFNAAVATGVPAKAFADCVDSITFCLSKGLCCPVGSVLCGDRDFIGRAHRNRKLFGGGMRQAGVLAAPGLIALDTMIDRLTEDHHRARVLAEEVQALGRFNVDMESVQTNMVFASTDGPAADIQEELLVLGVQVLAVAPTRLRMVLHHDIDDSKLGMAIEAFKKIAQRVFV